MPNDKKLQLKYRPSTFGEVIGQDGIVKILRRSVLDIPGKMEQAAIFHGPFGSGKTTTARIVARSILCPDRKENGDPCNVCNSCQMFFNDTHPGYTEIDGANITKVEDFRRILDSTNYQVVGSRYTVKLVDECHMMSKSSQNLLLKPLEEGIDGVFWFFCTTEYNKIIDTIRSRCVDYRIRPIPHQGIVERVQEICTTEGIGYESSAIEALVQAKKGHFRDVLVFIGKIRDLGDITEDIVYDYLDVGVNDSYFNVLLSLKEDPGTAMQSVEDALLKVSASDVYSGIAQAALDAYKHSQGLRPALLIRDKDLPQRLHSALGNDITAVAQYLIDQGGRRMDNNYLTSTLLMLRRRMNSVSRLSLITNDEPQVVVREVVKEVAAVTTPAAKPTPTVATPTVRTATPTPVNKAPTGTKKSSRPVLTDLDHKARKKPSKSKKTVRVDTRNARENKIMSADEFGLLLQRGQGNAK